MPFHMTGSPEVSSYDFEMAANNRLKDKLAHLKASATQQYSLKNYSAAAEFYSQAAEVQDAINGEMSPENADLLYQYGRCLYHVGVSNSDVLGGKVGGSEEPKKKKRKISKDKGESSAAGAVTGGSKDVLADIEEKVESEVKEESTAKAMGSNPLFQFTGDENFTDSEDDEDAEAAEGEDGEEEEDDDFAIAYEVLDVARVLLRRKIESLQPDDKTTLEPPELRQLKERLADTHDLQAEIKLENEQFADAVTDGRESLSLKLELYPQESGIVAEAHYKLAIALDFASLPTAPETEEPGAARDVPQPDEAMRAEAASEMEKAIASCHLRIEKETDALSELPAAKQEASKRSIADVKAVVADMKNRLIDLKAPAIAKTEPEVDDGVLGALVGESKEEHAKRIEDATAKANDLSGLVKRKKPKAEPVANESEGKGKRKAVDEMVEEMIGKKAKFDGA